MVRRRKVDVQEIRRVARENFGYESLRPGQEQVLRLVLNGRDTLSIMPTGSGKSAIYQIAALFIDGPSVIVSPLIALQKDQLESIEDKELPGAAVVNSLITAQQRRDAFDDLAGGSLEFLFVAPEQFGNEQTREQIMAHKPSLFVVDEAHCVSEWGHDFRPDYAQLKSVIEALGHPVVLALTATASPAVRRDIIDRLGMRSPQIVVWGFDRPNIWLGVEECADEEVKKRVLAGRIAEWAKPMIIYVATQRHAEEIAAIARGLGHEAAHYHGGMKKAERHGVQDAFMAGEMPIIVATNAFGMGVDKPDVRTVIHYDVPDSLDSYYQEVGRGGRDGQASKALLLFRPEDLGMRRAMAASGKLTEEQVTQVADVVMSRREAVEPEEVAEATDLSKSKVKTALSRLEEVGAVELKPGGAATPAGRKDMDDAAEEAAAEQELFRDYRKGRVELIRDYAQTRGCRRNYLLNYFGEVVDGPCGHCDNCDAGLSEKHEEREAESDLPFAPKSRVVHAKYGEGVVMRYEGDKVIVLFEDAGYKELVTQYVVEHKLLRGM